MSSKATNGAHAFDLSDTSAIAALERRLEQIDARNQLSFEALAAKLDRILTTLELERDDRIDMDKRWAKLVDRDEALSKRVAALETRGSRRRK